VIKVGDKVSFINTTGYGIVKSVSLHRVLVEDNHGFELDLKLSDVVLYNSPDAYKLPEKILPKEKTPKQRKRNAKVLSYGKFIDKGVLEIDLHIEELTESHTGLANAEIIQLQLKTFRRAVNEAIEMRLKKLIVIHGVGLGVLKEEIRKELADYPGFEYHDASYLRYGFGATEIVLRGY
jgi:dsDNA-specific endonuclease/ATPase MutS2